ncbi:hypothetical protein MD484_g1447, partial [Candolleomyces efflorescens]
MNSVLQGLIATRLLSDLVHFAPVPPAVQERSAVLLAGQRSPQLTNGHHLSGPYEQPWVNTMPIGDVFLSVMYKAWDQQARRQREILSPRSILGTLGQKYDQYLDFAQQDAHEFLRILLDAMRMEEWDIIKKRQPPPPPAPKRRRRSTIVPAKLPSNDEPPPEEPAPIPEDEKLMSFVDMIFGGKLTSILVCQKCKNISQTYEDFNDISLSIKPEDYIHRKRDKFKNFAKRFTAFPSAGPNNVPTPTLLNPMEIQRPSSVPPSPKERPEGQLVPRDEPPPSSTVRRRSLDIPPEAHGSEKLLEGTEGEPVEKEKKEEETGSPSGSGSGEVASAAATESDSDHILVNVTGPEGKRVEFIEVSSKPEKDSNSKDKEKSEKKKEDNWAKLGRRFSLGLGKSKERKSRSEDKALHRISAPIIEGVALDVVQDDTSSKSKRVSTDSPTPRASFSNAVSILTGRSPSPSPKAPAFTDSPRPSIDPSITPTPSAANVNAATGSTASTSHASSPSLIPTPSAPRSKSPKPPKASAAEAEYLRKILADVSTGSSNPLSTLFRPQSHHHHHHHNHLHPLQQATKNLTSGALSPHNVWLGMNQFTGIEECLRMFTAVEVLDGENMVGCRRCWKIANGVWPKRKEEEGVDEEDSDSVENEGSSAVPASQPLQDTTTTNSNNNDSDNNGSMPLHHLPTSISTPTVAFFSESDARRLDNADTRSISSLPTGVSSSSPLPPSGQASPAEPRSPVISRTNSESGESSSFESAHTTPGGLPIPVIETTGPDPPTANGLSSTASSIISVESTSESLDDGGVGAQTHPPAVLSALQKLNGIVAPKPTRPNLVNHSQLVNGATVNSKDSLPVPVHSHRRRAGQGDNNGGMTTDEDESSADESDTSMGTTTSMSEAESSSAMSTGSAGVRPSVPPGLEGVNGGVNSNSTASAETATATPGPPAATAPPPAKKKPSKPKPVIMRPAYKRYLIATPPPVLVVHLKRFQQLNKSPFLSFSHGFKKLDDYITFPEYLDLTPFLAPRKEDYGLGKKSKLRDLKEKAMKGKEKEEERCMYRLYAVVVHIGNMLGGHYIAYTALPSRSPILGEGWATKAKSQELQQKEQQEKDKQKQLQAMARAAFGVQSPSASASSLGAGQQQAQAAAGSGAPLPDTPKTPTAAATAPTLAAASQPLTPPVATSASSSSSSSKLATPTAASQPGPPNPKESEKEQPSSPQERQWAYISDTIVRLTTLEEVLSAKAYICMYERCC